MVAEQPKGGWDFRTKTNPDGFKRKSPGKLQQRIKGSLLEQPWRYNGFSIHRAPGAWSLQVQMDRAGVSMEILNMNLF